MQSELDSLRAQIISITTQLDKARAQAETEKKDIRVTADKHAAESKRQQSILEGQQQQLNQLNSLRTGNSSELMVCQRELDRCCESLANQVKERAAVSGGDRDQMFPELSNALQNGNRQDAEERNFGLLRQLESSKAALVASTTDRLKLQDTYQMQIVQLQQALEAGQAEAQRITVRSCIA